MDRFSDYTNDYAKHMHKIVPFSKKWGMGSGLPNREFSEP
jgi:hypothetical protein